MGGAKSRVIGRVRERSRLLLEALESRILLSAADPFTAPVFTAVAGKPQLVTGTANISDSFDADGNGFNDVVISYDDGGSPPAISHVSIMLGHSGGTYTEQNIAAPAGRLVEADLANFDSGTKPDVAVQWEASTSGVPTQGHIDIYLNNGNGTFTQAGSDILVAPGSTMNILDVNGDGKQDLFVTNPTNDGVSVYLGKGDGTFQSPMTTNFGSGKTITYFNSDLNGDQVLDVLLNYTGTPQPPDFTLPFILEEHLGHADGSFNVAADWTDPANDSHFQSVEKFSGSSSADLLVYHRASFSPADSTDVVVFKNDGTGQFTNTFTKTLANGYAGNGVAVDLNLDSKLDLVLTDGVGTLSSQRTVFVEKGAGNATFTETQTLPISDLVFVEIGGFTDVDHDGFPDLVADIWATGGGGIATDWGAQIFFNHHDGTFLASPVTVKPAVAPTAIELPLPLDLNGDHLLDMTFVDNPQDTSTADQISVFMNSGGRTFGPEKITDFGANTRLNFELFDLNGDGNADAIPSFNVDAQDTATGFTFWQGNGDGTFTSAASPDLFPSGGRAQAGPIPISFRVGGSAIDLLFIGASPTGLDVALNTTNTSGADKTAPTADLADPVNGGSISLTTLNSRHTLDVTFSDAGGSGLNASTITDAGREFTLSGAGAAGVVVNGAPALVSGTTYRYSFTGSFSAGPVNVNFTAGAWADGAGNHDAAAVEGFTVTAADTTPPTADLADPANDSVISRTTLNPRGTFDVTFSDTGGSGLNASTVTDAGQEFTLTGAGAVGVTVNGAPTLVSGTTYRYSFTGSFSAGPVGVNFTAGSFADAAGNANAFALESFMVTSAPAATQLVFSQQPSDALAGATISPAVVVDIKDAGGNLVTSDSSNVTLTLSSGTFSDGLSTETVAALNGEATFSSLLIDAAGSYTLTASDSTDSLSNFASNNFVISPALAAQLAFTTQPSGAVAGTTIRPPVAVAVEDEFGNVVTTDTSNVTVALGSGSTGAGSLSGTLAVSALNGVATFSNLSVTEAGFYDLLATDGTLTSATSAGFTITLPASKVVFVQQPSGTTVDATITPAVTVDVEDANGTLVTSDTSSVTIALDPSSTGTGLLSGTLTVSAVNGVARFSNLLLTDVGGYALRATDDALTPATSDSFNVAPAALTLIATKTSPDGNVHVSIFDLGGPPTVDPANVKVVFGKNDSVSSISLGGTQSMEGLGLVISGATSVGAITDARTTPGTVAFIASDSSIGSLTLKSGMSGFNLNGLTLGGLVFPVNIDGDGSTTDSTALYSTGTITSVTLGGMDTGDVFIGGEDAKTMLSNKSFTIKNGGLAGDLVTNGAEGAVTLAGDFDSHMDIAGALTSLTIKGGNFSGTLFASGPVGAISISSQKVAGVPIGGGVTAGATIDVTGADAKTNLSLKSFSATGAITGLAMTLNGGLGTLKGAGWSGGSLLATSSGAITLTGDFATQMNLLGPLTSLTIKGGNFSGHLTGQEAVGAISISSQKVAGVPIGGAVTTGATIDIFGVDPKTGLSLKSFSATGAITGLAMTLTGGLGTLKGAGWSGGSLAADSSGAITLTGDFATQMNLAGPLASLTIKGGDFSGGLDAQGPVGAISISSQKVAGVTVGGNITSSATFAFSGADPKTNFALKSLTATGTVTGLNLASSFGLGSITTGSWTGGGVTAPFLASLKVNGDLTNAAIGLTGQDAKGNSLGSLSVLSWLRGSTVRSDANMASVTVGGIWDSNVFAGIALGVTGLPTSASDFVAPAKISSFTVKGTVKQSGEFSMIGSNIAAHDIGTISLARVNLDNGGVPFGLAAFSIAGITLQDINGTLHRANLDLPSDSFVKQDAHILIL